MFPPLSRLQGRTASDVSETGPLSPQKPLDMHPRQDALKGAVHAVVPADVAPQFGPLHVFRPRHLALPFVRKAVYDAADIWIVVAVGVEQAALLLPRTQAQLEHIARLVGVVGLGAMPEGLMQEGNGAGLADKLPLPDDVLVAGDAGVADAAQVGTGQDESRSRLLRHVMGEVHRLDVKGERAGVNDGIGVPELRRMMVWPDDMQRRVIIDRVLADKALENAFHLRQLENGMDGLRFIPIALARHLIRVDGCV